MMIDNKNIKMIKIKTSRIKNVKKVLTAEKDKADKGWKVLKNPGLGRPGGPGVSEHRREPTILRDYVV